MLCALIMAGGKGERFWPLSTDENPKQFLNLLGDKTMIQMTVDRIEKLIPIERIFIVTGRIYVDIVKKQLPDLPERNIIVEPVGRNTAPCIGLSAFIIEKYYKNSNIVVLPSDHLIENEEKFLDIIKSGDEFIFNKPEAIITIGMKPDRPETGYGYIEYSDKITYINENQIAEVKQFVEKPDLETAKYYVNKGTFLWNGGMFIWKTTNILKLTKQYLNKTYQILSEIAIAEEDFNDILEQKYCQLDSISVDYGIMEKAENIYVMPSDFGWDDVGTWHSVERIREKDNNENVCTGEIKLIDSRNNIIIGRDKPIIIAGLDNIFVVESDELIFIASKQVIDNIKDIKNKII